jgi:hypothetical protein
MLCTSNNKVNFLAKGRDPEVLTTSILIGEIRESPDVSDTHRQPDTRQQEFPAGTPVPALRH